MSRCEDVVYETLVCIITEVHAIRGGWTMLRLAIFILVIMLIYGGAYSVISIIKPEVIVESTVKGATGKNLEDAQNDGYLKAFIALGKDAGLFGLSAIVCGFFILFSGFRKARKWAWFAFLLAGGIGWLGGLILTISIGDRLNILIRAVGTIMALAGLFIPIKEFFGKKKQEPVPDNSLPQQ